MFLQEGHAKVKNVNNFIRECHWEWWDGNGAKQKQKQKNIRVRQRRSIVNCYLFLTNHDQRLGQVLGILSSETRHDSHSMAISSGREKTLHQ